VHCIEILVAAGGGIGNGEKILGRDAAFTAAAPHVDAPVARDLKHPGDGRRPAAVIEMRLLPDRLHHVLRQIFSRRRREAKPHKLCLHARPKMVEQNCECSSVAHCTDGREQFVKLVLSRSRTACGDAIINVSAAGQIHNIPPSAPKNSRRH
jgi:hypothetical protein